MASPENPASDPAATPDALLASVTAEAAFSEQAAESTARALEPPSLADEDRSWIARLIVRLFIAAVAAYLLFLVVQGITTGVWAGAAAQAEEMIKTIVVPVVTLVLGYYFGQSTKG